jgi:4-methylaminobutanoate oxidase (formaldehyde-forming)
MSNTSPRADVLIIGGGVAGLSTAYQLTKRGLKVTLLERQQLGAGSTGQAAGLLGQIRRTESATRIMVDGLDVVRQLEQETETKIFYETGSVRLAATEPRVQDTEEQVDWGRRLGLKVDLIDNKQLRELLPHMNCDDILAASFCPTDGHLMPHELAAAYATMARRQGATIIQKSPVREIIIDSGKAVGVRTDDQTHHADKILNATGPWSYVMADQTRSTLQTAAIGHYYLTTKPSTDHPVDRMSPGIRDYDGRIYARAEAGGLLVGIYEAQPVHYDTSNLGDDFVMSDMRAARDSLSVAYLLESANHRFPLTKSASFHVTTGIMTFSPNGNPLCGELPNVKNLFHCAGFCGHGIVQSPTAGKIMADLLTDIDPPYDMDALMADRYQDLPGYQDREQIAKHCEKAYAGHYGPLQKT